MNVHVLNLTNQIDYLLRSYRPSKRRKRLWWKDTTRIEAPSNSRASSKKKKKIKKGLSSSQEMISTKSNAWIYPNGFQMMVSNMRLIILDPRMSILWLYDGPERIKLVNSRALKQERKTNLTRTWICESSLKLTI